MGPEQEKTRAGKGKSRPADAVTAGGIPGEAEERRIRPARRISLRPFSVSDVDFVISRQLALYNAEYGFDSGTWKAYLTGGVHAFLEQFDPARDCMLICEQDGLPAGCIAITHADEATAQLRFFFLEPAARGQGAGRLLLDQAVDFCRQKKYDRIVLWTFSTLPAARHLYGNKGFRITDTRENTEWGKRILEERWELEL